MPHYTVYTFSENQMSGFLFVVSEQCKMSSLMLYLYFSQRSSGFDGKHVVIIIANIKCVFAVVAEQIRCINERSVPMCIVFKNI